MVECAGNEATIDQAIHMTNRGEKLCLAAFPHDPVALDLAYLVKNNIHAYGIRGELGPRNVLLFSIDLI